MATNLFQQLYNTVDVAVVGRYAGTEALAAVGSAGQLTAFLIYFFYRAVDRGGIVISHSIGSRDWEKVNIQVHTALALAVTAGIALTVIGVWAAPLLLGVAQYTGDCHDVRGALYSHIFPWYAADDAF